MKVTYHGSLNQMTLSSLTMQHYFVSAACTYARYGALTYRFLHSSSCFKSNYCMYVSMYACVYVCEQLPARLLVEMSARPPVRSSPIFVLCRCSMWIGLQTFNSSNCIYLHLSKYVLQNLVKLALHTSRWSITEAIVDIPPRRSTTGCYRTRGSFSPFRQWVARPRRPVLATRIRPDWIWTILFSSILSPPTRWTAPSPASNRSALSSPTAESNA